MEFVQTFTGFSSRFYDAEAEKFQKIHPIVSSLKYKLPVKIPKHHNREMPFLHPTRRLKLNTAFLLVFFFGNETRDTKM